MIIRKKNSDDISYKNFQPSQFFVNFEIFFSKLEMAIAQSFLKIQTSSRVQKTVQSSYHPDLSSHKSSYF